MSTGGENVAGNRAGAVDCAERSIERDVPTDASINCACTSEAPCSEIDRDSTIVGGDISYSDDQAVCLVDSERFS